MSLNNVVIMGNVVSPLTLRTLQSGTKVLDIRLASNRKYRDSKGEMQTETLFIDVTAMGSNAESISKFSNVGSPIIIVGHLKMEQWKDAKTEMQREKIRIVCDSFSFCPRNGGFAEDRQNGTVVSTGESEHSQKLAQKDASVDNTDGYDVDFYSLAKR